MKIKKWQTLPMHAFKSMKPVTREWLIIFGFISALALFAFIPSSIYSFSEINSLPLHPLVIHLTIVFIPLVAFLILISIWSKLRIQRIIILTLLFISTASAIIANRSGEALSLAVGYPTTHAQLGQRVAIASALLFLVFILLGRRRDLGSKIILSVFSVLILPLIYFAGHSGAELVWKFKYQIAIEPISMNPNLKISFGEIEANNSSSRCWSVIDSKVYDFTSFIYRYPGEKSDLLKVCGIDGSDLYRSDLEGSKFPRAILNRFQIGKIER